MIDSTAVVCDFDTGHAAVALSPKSTLLYDLGMFPEIGEGFSRSIGVKEIDGGSSISIVGSRFKLLPLEDGWYETFSTGVATPLELLQAGFPFMVLGYGSNLGFLAQHDQELFSVVVYPDFTYYILMWERGDNVYLTAPDNGNEKQWYISNYYDRLTPNIFNGLVIPSFGNSTVEVLNGDAEIEAVAADVVADFCAYFNIPLARFAGKYAGQIFYNDTVFTDAIDSNYGFPLAIVDSRTLAALPATRLDPTTIGVVPAGSMFLIPSDVSGDNAWYLAYANVDIPSETEELPHAAISLVVVSQSGSQNPLLIKVNPNNVYDWSFGEALSPDGFALMVDDLASTSGVYHTASNTASWFAGPLYSAASGISAALANSVVGLLPAE